MKNKISKKTGNGEAAAAASTEPWRCFYIFGLKRRPLPPQAPGLPPSRAALAAQQPVNLNAPVADFRQQVLNYERWREGMDLSVRHVKAAALPECALEAARKTQAAIEASRARFAAKGGGGAAAAAAAAAAGFAAASGVKRDREEEEEEEEEEPAAAAATAATGAANESPAKRAKEEGETAAAAASGDLKAAEAEAGMAAAGDVGEWAGIDAGKG